MPIVGNMKKRMGLEYIPSKFFEAIVEPSLENFSSKIKVTVNKRKVLEYIDDLKSEIKRYEEMLEKAEQFNYVTENNYESRTGN